MEILNFIWKVALTTFYLESFQKEHHKARTFNQIFYLIKRTKTKKKIKWKLDYSPKGNQENESKITKKVNNATTTVE